MTAERSAMVVFRAPAGSYVLKVRGVPHTFWNIGPEPARVLEIISPASFERYFEELKAIFSLTLPGQPPAYEETYRSYQDTIVRTIRDHRPHFVVL